MYPLDSSRLRLGWAFPATWGGNFYGRWEASPAEREWTPGVVLQLQQERWHAFVGLKTSSLTESLAPMVGAGVSLPLSLRAEVQAAHIQRFHGAAFQPMLEPETEQFPIEGELDEVLGGRKLPPTPYAQGASARLVHEQGGPIGDPVDFRQYGSAPALFDEVLRPESYPEGFAHSVSLEATHAIMSTVWWGSGYRRTHTNIVALDARMRWNRLRVHALGLVRGAGAVVLDDGYLWGDFARGSQRRPELGASLGVDYHVAAAGLTPGLGVRVLRPAAHLRNEGISNPGASWWLVSSEGIAKVTPVGSVPEPRVSARASLKWNLLPWLSAVGELSYTWAQDTLSAENDPFYFSPRRSSERVVDSAGLDFNLLVQARY